MTLSFARDTHVHTHNCWWKPDEAAWMCRPEPQPSNLVHLNVTDIDPWPTAPRRAS